MKLCIHCMHIGREEQGAGAALKSPCRPLVFPIAAILEARPIAFYVFHAYTIRYQDTYVHIYTAFIMR